MLKATVSNIKARIAAGESIDSIVANGLGPEWASFAAGSSRRSSGFVSSSERAASELMANRHGALEMIDPLSLLADDRRKARAANDPWANLCALATIDAIGEPQARVLVLRDLERDLRFSSTARVRNRPKSSSPRRHAVLVYLASLGVQYRTVRGTRAGAACDRAGAAGSIARASRSDGLVVRALPAAEFCRHHRETISMEIRGVRCGSCRQRSRRHPVQSATT